MSNKVFAGVLSFIAVTFLAIGSAFAVISNSAHDFSSATSWNPSQQLCGVCHVPHNSGSTIAPLWGHTLSTATYTVYSTSISPSLNAVVGQPSASSRACLSCHDGTVAVNAFGGNTGNVFLTGGDNLGTDLSNDHPVSFTYDAALATADGTLRDPTTTAVASLGAGRTITTGMLIGGRLECSSCHDVHADKGASATGGNKLLLVSNSGSVLCLTCHNK